MDAALSNTRVIKILFVTHADYEEVNVIDLMQQFYMRP